MLFPALLFAAASLANGPTIHSPEEWSEDLAHLVEEVRGKHPVPYLFGANENEFLDAVDDLAERIPTLSDGRIVK